MLRGRIPHVCPCRGRLEDCRYSPGAHLLRLLHGIVPQTIRKDVRKVLEISKDAQQEQQAGRRKLTDAEREATIRRLEKEMKEASKMLEFEYAALLRDQIIALRGEK